MLIFIGKKMIKKRKKYVGKNKQLGLYKQFV